MARKAHVEEGSAATPGTISVDEFRKTRDSVIQGLTGLQLAVGNLLSAYMAHCNSILGEGGAEALDGNELNRLAGTFTSAVPVEIVTDSKKEKKKKEKKERDPDLPKRPLTAAFLYGQTARPIIKRDLENALPAGEKLGANAVNEEVTKRWNNMAEEEKQLWRNAYQENMIKYKVQMEEYAAKKGKAVTELEQAVAGAAATDAEGSSDESEVVAPPPKAPSPPAAKGNKRRKMTKENGVAVAQSPVPIPTSAAKPAATPAKAGAKKKAAAAAAAEKEAGAEEPKKKPRGRKSRGGAEEEAVEPTPETEKKERKRKRKDETA